MSGQVQKMEKPDLYYLKRIVRRGSEGKDVKVLQQRLDTLNTYYGFFPTKTLEDTGKFDQKTHSFVVHFQIWADICTDGWVDKVTADSIEDFFQAVAQTYTIPKTDMRHEIWDRYN